ncbi:MAG: hypothetical protein ACRD2R_00745 [Terriglobales bacterium]
MQRKTTEAEAKDPHVAELVLKLQDFDPEIRKQAAVSLGEMGPRAGAAVAPLLLSLQGENVMLAAFDDSYPGAVTAALAAILQEDAVLMSAVYMTKGQDQKAVGVIWGNVLMRVGPSTVPCICQFAERKDGSTDQLFYLYWLGVMGNRAGKDGLKETKDLAEATLRKAASDPDPEVRKEAESALARLIQP